MRKYVWMLGVTYLMNSIGLFGQVSNDSVYTHLIQEYANELSAPIQMIKGLVFPEDSSFFTLDSTSNRQVSLAEPEILFIPLEKRIFKRTVSVRVQLRDSIARQKTLRYTDTLALNVVKQIRRKSHPLVKGDNPTLWGRWIQPAILITTGVGGIFALFFLRSD